jgi:hypothetical protein
MKLKIIFMLCCCFGSLLSQEGFKNEQGKYFQKKTYKKTLLPKWEETKDTLPEPIYDENPLLVQTYWKAWELAFKNFHEPNRENGFVSQFIDAAFNQNIFLWDTGFMSMFCNFAHGLVPGIESLDNFYCKQHESGEICREINRSTGADFKEWINEEDKSLFSRWGWDGSFKNDPVQYIGRDVPKPNPKNTLDALNHPILAWAELESYRLTGDKSRLKNVYEPLKRYYFALKKYLLQGNGLFITDWASMDNSPRNKYLKGGGIGIDISAEMVLFASNLKEIAHIIKLNNDIGQYTKDIESISNRINELCWDDKNKFYYDLSLDGVITPIKTIGAYWTLISGVSTRERAQYLVGYLLSPKSFGTLSPVPTTGKDSEGYDSTGGYWRGAVWAPTNTMVIRGLEKYGFYDIAKEVAMKHLLIVANVFKKTGTIWENYEPENIEPGKVNGKNVKQDFVGWSGIAPIMYFIEYGIGIKADAPNNEIVWNLNSLKKTGCKKFRFNGIVVDLIAEPEKSGKMSITIESSDKFRLKLIFNHKQNIVDIRKGLNTFVVS